MNVWDEAVEKLNLNRAYIKQQFYTAIYDRIRTVEQALIVSTVLSIKSPLSYKAAKKQRGNYGVEQTSLLRRR